MTVLVGLVLTACGPGGFSGLYNAPLPGGADVGDHPYRVTVEFSDVLDLVPQATVKVNDVQVGRVERVRLAEDTRSALVDIVVNGDVELPANAIAELRQTSLLGEKFVDLRPPADAEATGRLADGDVIPLARTSRHAELEEVFGALSLLLNGGGVEQLHTIASELNNAMRGNEAEIKALLSRVNHLVTELDGQKAQITKAIDGLAELSRTLVREKRHLTEGLDHLAPGMRVIANQRDQIVDMLTALRRLSDVTVDTVNKSREQLVANLRALEPTLRKLAESGDNLTEALKILPTYPLPWNAGNTMKGDYANVDVEFDLNLDQLIGNLSRSGQSPIPKLPSGDDGPPLPLPETPELPKLPSLPGLPGAADSESGSLLGSLLGGL
ncbi:MCE family protein [Haloechinothrix salitolerans]|uniref:MCE family protein n=1 Tax=Haloechinothrix salitolerans TaxID=926830 RepID=A0ABW2BUA7_9PSEU